MPLLASSLIAGGLSTSAQEDVYDKTKLGHTIQSSVNHGDTVSTLAKSLPGSPEKGMMIRSIAKTKEYRQTQKAIAERTFSITYLTLP
ncbi:hypothetical protein RJD24_08340 [Bacillaceae bacterium IKA-2]|nr:hypothetical protein RJD24_08340 [Bacillaceae bacterium IKA-2]